MDSPHSEKREILFWGGGLFAVYLALQLWILPAMGVGT